MNGLKSFGNGRFQRGKRGREGVISTCPTRPIGIGTQQRYEQNQQPVCVDGSEDIFVDVQRVASRVLQKHADDVSALFRRGVLLPVPCDAFDDVAWQESLDTPLNIEMLRKNIDECMQKVSGDNIDKTTLNLIANILTSWLVEVVRQLPTSTMDRTPVRWPTLGALLNTLLQSYHMYTEEMADMNVTRNCAGILPTPPPLPSVFSESAVSPVNCVVFECLPKKYCSSEAMKEQLEEMCARIPNAFFLNVYCIPDEGRAIVSFNSNETAAAAMFLVNSANVSRCVQSDDGNINNDNDNNSLRVRVVAASEAQQQLLWGPLVMRVKKKEKEWSDWHVKYTEHPPHVIRREWTMAKAKGVQLDKELQELLSSGDSKDGVGIVGETTASLSTEQMKRKLQILQSLLECKRAIELAETKMRVLYGDSYAEKLTIGPTQPTYSVSSATVSNPRKLLFIHELPCRLDDEEVLEFLRIVGMKPVHIWRDPAEETSICVETPSVGHVFSVLRLLDGSGMRFCGAFFSRNRVSLRRDCT